MIPKHLMSLWWPVPPVPTTMWGQNEWTRYVLSVCACPECPTLNEDGPSIVWTRGNRCARPSYIDKRPITEVAPNVYEVRCVTCDHVWGQDR